MWMFALMLFTTSLAWGGDKNQKIEDLYIWKMSDELKLTTKQEQVFSKIIRDLNSQKSLLNQELEMLLKKMKTSSEKENNQLLSQYKKTLKKLNELSLSEIERLEKQLGSKSATQYLQQKQILAEQIRSALSNQQSKD